MTKLTFLLVLLSILTVKPNNIIACDGLNVTVINSYIGNGEYLITVEVCEVVSNTETLNGAVTDSATIYGLIITVNGANIIGINTPSITGASTGITIFPTQTASNQVEYGDWGNSTGSSPVFLSYSNPVECWTFEFIVDAPGTSVDIWGSSSTSSSAPGSGMTDNGGTWGCGGGVAVPPAVCNSDWTPPVLCVGSTTLVDLNATTAATGVFSGTGVNSATGMFDPTGFTSNASITLTVGDGGFNCSTTQEIVITDLAPPPLTDQTICVGENVNLDATISVTANCTYSLILDDSYGDGWNGADLDIYINGVLYAQDQTVPSCGGSGSVPCQATINIPVVEGDIILFNYSGGTYDNENTLFLYDGNGTLVSTQNDPPNGNLGTGIVASCPSPTINYSWSPTTGLSDPNIPNPIASPLVTTTYVVDITSPDLPCPGQASVTITVDPCVSCSIDAIAVNIGPCNPGNWLNVSGTIDYTTPPATGLLIVGDCQGNQDTLFPPFGTSFNFSFTADADGSACTITAYFTDLPTCSISSNEIYPPTCGCTVDAGPDTTICFGESFTLVGSASDNYSWDQGLGAGQSYTVTPSVTTQYIVTGTNLAGCVWTDTAVVTVNALPIVDAGSDLVICEGTEITLSASGALNYVWDNGVSDGVSFSGMTSQTYTVIGTDVNGCVDTNQLDVTVNVWDDSTFQYDGSTFCVTGTDPIINFTGTAGGVFTSTPAGLTLDANSGAITLISSTDGSYIVTYTTSGVCPTSLDQPMEITGAPIADFTFGSYCLNDADPSPTFINGGTGGVFSASPAGLSYNTISGLVDLDASTPGIYTLTNDINVVGCAAVQAQFQIEIFNLPTALISGGGLLCQGEILPDVQFDFTETGNWTVGYELNGAGQNVTTGDNPYIIVEAPGGSYELTQIIDNSTGCSNTASGMVEVIVNPIPNVIQPSNLIYCDGNQAVIPGFTSNETGTVFDWVNLGDDIGIGMSGSGNIVSFTAVNTGVLPIVATLEVTPTLNGCVGPPVQFTVTINASPIIDVVVTIPPSCLPTPVIVTNNGTPVVNCLWFFGDGTTSNVCGTQSHTYNTAGCFDITLTVTDNAGCSATEYYPEIVCLNPNPLANFLFDPSTTDISYTDIEFQNLSENASYYTWDFGDNSSSSNMEHPFHTYPDVPGEYIITLVAENDFGCVDTAYSKIIIHDVLIYYVPNAFTPDNDEFNQTFKPIFTSGFEPMGYTLLIYDRWGELIFESHNTDVGWDGRFLGKYVQDGVYVWKLEFKETMSDKRHEKYGHVTIIR